MDRGTSRPNHPRGRGLYATRDNLFLPRVVWTDPCGSDDLVRYAGPSTRRIDAHGATIIPGLLIPTPMLILGENSRARTFVTPAVEPRENGQNAAAPRAR